MSKPSVVERMRNNLQPRGTAPVVQLRLSGYGMFDSEFVAKCIDELERIPARALVGDMPTNLEKLAYQLLLDSAFIDLKHEQEQEERLAQYAKDL